jgi:hypothetical protein
MTMMMTLGPHYHAHSENPLLNPFPLVFFLPLDHLLKKSSICIEGILWDFGMENCVKAVTLLVPGQLPKLEDTPEEALNLPYLQAFCDCDTPATSTVRNK